MSEHEIQGRPASELSDAELEQQGTQAHATRNWVFLHGSAEQFARHTTRMLELEQEYVHRFPRRTWQGSGGSGGSGGSVASRGSDPAVSGDGSGTPDPALAFLQRLADAGGRLHKLEAHQAAREVGLARAAVARLYTADPALVGTEGEDRVLTGAGRERLRAGA
ncbi:DUF6158 family protein [Lapillicoccus sp.]|uniref:DUF6158 family protein n=1 Tax=Lapillicoccus sp. TaxID=1909287 RepID=UPI0039832EB8